MKKSNEIKLQMEVVEKFIEELESAVNYYGRYNSETREYEAPQVIADEETEPYNYEYQQNELYRYNKALEMKEKIEKMFNFKDII